jgi:branched-chain amino acid transport system ATP-binding protein
VTFAVKPGEIFSIIGPNGAGKTSVLNCISGYHRPTGGSIWFDGCDITARRAVSRAGLGIGRTFQNLGLFAQMTVVENILIGRHHLMHGNVLTGALYWIGGAWGEEVRHRKIVDEIIAYLGLLNVRNARVDTLPYGLCKRVELARAVALQPKLVLLDEPMAGMNAGERRDMAKRIVGLSREREITVLMIEHDIGVVTEISDRVLALDSGQPIALATPKEVLADPRVRAAYVGAGNAEG